jgi:hypothetical protein
MKPRLGTLAVTAAVAAITLLAPTAFAAPSSSWAPTASMGVARIDHAATRLPGGRVLVAGGVTTGPAPTATAEVFAPDIGDLVAGRQHAPRALSPRRNRSA